MKKLCSLLALAVVGWVPAHAQVFQPNQVRGGIIGAVAGALIGGHNNDRWAEGTAIGAVAGTIIGSAIPSEPQPAYGYGYDGYRGVREVQVVGTAPCVTSPQVVYVQPAPVVRVVQRPRVVYVAPAPVVVIGGRGHHARPVYNRHRRW